MDSLDSYRGGRFVLASVSCHHQDQNRHSTDARICLLTVWSQHQQEYVYGLWAAVACLGYPSRWSPRALQRGKTDRHAVWRARSKPLSEAVFVYRNEITGYYLLATNVFPEWWDEPRSAGLVQTPSPVELIASMTEDQWETEYVFHFNTERCKYRDITEPFAKFGFSGTHCHLFTLINMGFWDFAKGSTEYVLPEDKEAD